MSEFFTAVERQSAAAAKLKAHYEKRLESLRKQNDNAVLTEQKTVRLRGRIGEVKALLALFEPGAAFDDESALFKD